MRITIYWGLYWGPFILGNYQVTLHTSHTFGPGAGLQSAEIRHSHVPGPVCYLPLEDTYPKSKTLNPNAPVLSEQGGLLVDNFVGTNISYKHLVPLQPRPLVQAI